MVDERLGGMGLMVENFYVPAIGPESGDHHQPFTVHWRRRLDNFGGAGESPHLHAKSSLY